MPSQWLWCGAVQEDCDAELLVRAQTATAARARRLCPFECSQAGTCAATAVAPGPSDFVDQALPGEPVDVDDSADGGSATSQGWLQVAAREVCSCEGGETPAVGPWCEARLAEPGLEFGVWTEPAVLSPLQFRPHRVALDPSSKAPLRLELQVCPWALLSANSRVDG